MENLKHLVTATEEKLKAWRAKCEYHWVFLTCIEKILALLHDLHLSIAFQCKWIIQ
jgi:hypothetical protein